MRNDSSAEQRPSGALSIAQNATKAEARTLVRRFAAAKATTILFVACGPEEPEGVHLSIMTTGPEINTSIEDGEALLAALKKTLDLAREYRATGKVGKPLPDSEPL